MEKQLLQRSGIPNDAAAKCGTSAGDRGQRRHHDAGRERLRDVDG